MFSWSKTGFRLGAVGEEQGFHQGFLGMQAIFRLVPDDRVGRIHQFRTDLLPPVGRQAVHVQGIPAGVAHQFGIHLVGGEQLRPLLDAGIAGIWNDMNEPAVFDRLDGTFPPEIAHDGDAGRVWHEEVHNAYGALHQRSSFRGLLKRDNNTQRPFVLTRSFFLGSQKFGAYWTGDNRSVFEEV